ncbi:hypothetical protein [Streptomyces gobiensis]|uniref:hypothetical protein n=1 Tax=Streptomyces gobiensis TaxID=2875706 RepID=UPI001E5BF5B4|nr:hypothetical protein [Streptomyces gobiensis]UGY90282.1 hypothetical protein test1122_00085 [Streptomyces gobiensis]UGY94929.1 hypothetical protein test1122_26455 [Streptomyces gobiensis]
MTLRIQGACALAQNQDRSAQPLRVYVAWLHQHLAALLGIARLYRDRAPYGSRERAQWEDRILSAQHVHSATCTGLNGAMAHLQTAADCVASLLTVIKQTDGQEEEALP